LTGFASGIPATAAIARTATNIHQGARSPFAAVLQGVLILIYVSLFSSLIAYIPMSTLAAILLLTAYNMSHLKQCHSILNLSPIADKIVLVACFTLTVCMDMVAGVTVGILLAALFSILPSLPAREQRDAD
jgi:sulfate permease, SulP family